LVKLKDFLRFSYFFVSLVNLEEPLRFLTKNFRKPQKMLQNIINFITNILIKK